MEKSIYTREYAKLLKLLVQKRKKSGVTQVELAAGLDTTQSVVSKLERGDRRIDVVQLLTICRLIGIELSEFVKEFEISLAGGKAKRKRS